MGWIEGCETTWTDCQSITASKPFWTENIANVQPEHRKVELMETLQKGKKAVSFLLIRSLECDSSSKEPTQAQIVMFTELLYNLKYLCSSIFYFHYILEENILFYLQIFWYFAD